MEKQKKAEIYGYSVSQDNTECRGLITKAYTDGYEECKKEVIKAVQGWLADNIRVSVLEENRQALRVLYDKIKNI